MPFREVDGRIMGPGVEDMKGGIVVGLTALAALAEMHRVPIRPVTALFTSDEEIGSPASRPLIEALARKSILVLYSNQPCQMGRSRHGAKRGLIFRKCTGTSCPRWQRP